MRFFSGFLFAAFLSDTFQTSPGFILRTAAGWIAATF